MRSLTSPQTPPASQVFVTVTGSVRQPGPMSLVPDSRLTACAAIVRAGGFAPGASLTNCHVFRITSDGKEERLTFNIMEVSKQPALDVTLQAGDTVVVPARDTSKRDALQAHLNSLAKALAERVSPGPLNAPLLHPMYPLKPPVPGLPTNSFTLLHPTLPPKPVQLAAAAPVPVAADVRRLTSPHSPDPKPEAPNQSLLTSAATSGDAPAEALRQQEQKLVLSKLLSKLLGEADQFRKIKSWTSAVVRYEEAVGLARELSLAPGFSRVEPRLPDAKPLQRLASDGPASTNEVAVALAGLTHCRVQLAVELQEKHDFKAAADEVDKILPFDPKSTAAEQFKQLNKRVETAHKDRLAGPQMTERSKVMTLVRDGKLYYEVGEYGESRKRLEEAITLDPANDMAYYYLRLVLASQFESDRRPHPRGRIIGSNDRWNAPQKPTSLPIPNPYFRTNSEAPFLTHSSKGAQRLNRKLEEIILPEVHFDGIPLAEVVKRLSEDAQKFDPEADPKKKGLNFLINDAVRPAPLLDASGNPVPVAQPVALSEGLIRVSTPLKNLTLRHALDVICKNAEQPTTFSVEEYAIAFIPRGDATFFSRMFRVSPDAFIQGLQGVVANPVLGVNNTGNAQGGQTQGQPAAGATTGPVRATVPATATATSSSMDINARVRQFFQSAGVTSLNATNPGTQVQFNPQTGLIRVRGTTNDLRIFEQSLRILAPLTNPAPTNSANPDSRTNSTNSIVTPPNPRTQRINRKLDEIILPEISFDDLFLPDAIKKLNAAAQKFDPEKKGLEFVINDRLPGAPTRRKNLDTTIVRLPEVIKNLTIRQALDAVCKGTEVALINGRSTGLQFMVSESGIVLSPTLPGDQKLVSRAFKLDPDVFIEKLQFYLNTIPAVYSAGDPTEQFKRLSPVDRSVVLNRQVQEFFGAYSLVVDCGSTNDPAAPQSFFNDQTGLLLIRGTVQELNMMQQAIELLATPLPPGFVKPQATIKQATSVAQAGPTKNEPLTAAASPNTFNRTNTVTPPFPHSSQGAQSINAKLDEIILPEVRFDSMLLPKVVSWLEATAKQFDPEKQGIEFRLSDIELTNFSLQPGVPAAPLLDPNGNPIAAAIPPDFGLPRVPVRLAVPLSNLTLRQTLEVICKTADVWLPDSRIRAGLKFSIEKDAVIISPVSPQSPLLLPRIFKVNSEQFNLGLQAVMGPIRTPFDEDPDEVVSTRKPGQGGLRGGSWNQIGHVNQQLRDYFQATGVSLLRNTNGPDSTQVFYNDRSGWLMTRATPTDLDLIETATTVLNGTAPQLVSVEKYPTGLAPKNSTTSTPTTPKANPSKLVQRIAHKLEEITFPLVGPFDNVPLPQVLHWLDANAKRMDPEQMGLNFLLSNVADEPTPANESKPPLFDYDGQLVMARQPAAPDLLNAQVKLPVPLRKLTLRQSLDLICKTAKTQLDNGQTVPLKWTIEEYGIVLAPRLPEQQPRLSPVLFKVDPEQFRLQLLSVTPEETLAPLRKDLRLAQLFSPSGTGYLTLTNKSWIGVGVVDYKPVAALHQLIRSHLITAGVTNLSLTNNPQATRVFYNDHQGLLLAVTTNANHLDLIRRSLASLTNRPPPQPAPK